MKHRRTETKFSRIKNSKGKGRNRTKAEWKTHKGSATQNCNQQTPKKAIRTTAIGERGNRAILNAINPEFCKIKIESLITTKESRNCNEFNHKPNLKPNTNFEN